MDETSLPHRTGSYFQMVWAKDLGSPHGVSAVKVSGGVGVPVD